MELPVGLYKKISTFLLSLPNLDGTRGRQAFIYKAGLDSELKNQIPFDEPSAKFIPHLLSLLLRCGTLRDERHALTAILETAMTYVGHDKRAHCTTLIQEIQGNDSKESSPPKEGGKEKESHSQP